MNTVLPRISIVSPTFNQGAFIEDAILSVLQQNYPNVQHIIIDGGSTDDTLDILKKYPHLEWISEKDNGQGDAINKGFDRVNGDIIGWLNTDDYYLPGTFDKMLEQFRKNADTDVVYGDINFVNKNKEYVRTVTSHVPNRFLSLFHCYIHSAAFFFKKRILDAGMRIDPDFDICMDKEFFAHLFFEKYKFTYLHDVLTAFRWHESNKSIDTSEVKKVRYLEGLKVFNRYSGVSVRVTSFTMNVYNVGMKLLLPYRKLLKVIH